MSAARERQSVPPPAPAVARAAASAGDGPEPLFPEELDSILDSGGPTTPPEDPVLARLFPDAYGDDPEAAGDFRRYTEQGLRSGKVAAARTVLATLPDEGGRVRLSAGDAEAWLRALNDVRLALGVLLGITEEYERELARRDRGRPAFGLSSGVRLADLPPGDPGALTAVTAAAGYARLHADDLPRRCAPRSWPTRAPTTRTRRAGSSPGQPGATARCGSSRC